MPKIPDRVSKEWLPWKPEYRGKVRDIYPVPGHDDLLAVVVTDRLSVFDVVLSSEVPSKGIVLNTHNLYIKDGLLRDGIIKNDIVASGKDIEAYLPKELRGNADLQARTTIVRKYTPIKFEIIIRDRLWGSAAKGYPNDSPYNPETGLLFGQFVGKGLKPGDEFPELVFDPTTKAPDGEHDERVTAQEVEDQYPGITEVGIKIFRWLQNDSRSKGFEPVDFKIELAYVNGEFILLDETATLDAARYWLIRHLEQFQAGEITKLPEMSKEYGRDCAKELGIEALAIQKRWEEAQQIGFKPIQSRSLGMIYRWMFQQITGKQLESFWQARGVELKRPGKLMVLTGSTTDDPQTTDGIANIVEHDDFACHVICSCHGCPDELMYLAFKIIRGDYGEIRGIIAGAGLAAHLPGMLKAFLSARGRGDIPVFGFGFENFDPDLAKRELGNDGAKRSVDQIPGQPLVLDGVFAYFSEKGFSKACDDAIKNDFLPTPMKKRQAVVRFPNGKVRQITHAEAIDNLSRLYDAVDLSQL